MGFESCFPGDRRVWHPSGSICDIGSHLPIARPIHAIGGRVAECATRTARPLRLTHVRVAWPFIIGLDPPEDPEIVRKSLF